MQPCRIHGPAGDPDRGIAILFGQHRHLGLTPEDTQLFTRRRAGHIERGQKNAFLVLGFEQAGQLACSGGLTATLQANHQDDNRCRAIDIERGFTRAKGFDQRIMHDLDDHLAGLDGFEDSLTHSLLPHRSNEGFDHRQGDISLNQRAPHFTEGSVHIGFGKGTPAPQGIKGTAQFFAQAFEHGPALSFLKV